MIKKINYVLGDNKKKFLVIVALICLSTIFISIVNPLALKWIFDEASIKADFNRFLGISFLSILLFTAWRCANYFISLSKFRIINRCKQYLINLLVQKYFNSDSRNIEDMSEGYYVSRLIDETEETVDSALGYVIEFAGAIASLVGGLLAILYISIEMTIILALIIPVLMLLSRHFSSKIGNINNLVSENSATINKLANKMLRSQILTKSHSLGNIVINRFNSVYTDALTNVFSLRKLNNLFGLLSGIFLSWMESAVIVLGGLAILTKYFSFGDFMGFMTGFWVVVHSVGAIINLYPTRVAVDVSISRLESMDSELSKEVIAYPTSGDIKFDNVSFSRGKNTIFNELDLSVKYGSRVLVLGPNGSGKTTLINLAANLLHYESGKIMTPPSVSAMIEPVFAPPLSLIEMIDTDRGRKDIIKAVISSLEIDKLLDCQIDELSLGQQKRALIALTLSKESDVYIFDEPLANIDVVSQNAVFDVILAFTKGKTLMMTMHEHERFLSQFDITIKLPISMQRIQS
jgi:ABC-type multidrug transport system fused ATPase/permease subunit